MPSSARKSDAGDGNPVRRNSALEAGRKPPFHRPFRSCEDPRTGPDQRFGTDPSEAAAGEPNAGGDHLGPQSIAGPRDEHHPAGGQVSTAEAGPWSAGELDASGEPFLFGCQGDRHPHLSPQRKIGLPSTGVGLHAGP